MFLQIFLVDLLLQKLFGRYFFAKIFLHIFFCTGFLQGWFGRDSPSGIFWYAFYRLFFCQMCFNNLTGRAVSSDFWVGFFLQKMLGEIRPLVTAADSSQGLLSYALFSLNKLCWSSILATGLRYAALGYTVASIAAMMYLKVSKLKQTN